jgi:hypothetical protein
MNKLLLILFLFCTVSVKAQQKDTTHFGVELDLLPYATGGYFAAAWAGKNQWRLRLLTASVNKPDWSTPDGFVNHHISAYALVTDYFLKPNWKGWWLGGGLVYWNSTIQTDLRLQTTRFRNFLLNGSLGYNVMLYKHLYLSPWAGLSIRTTGDRNSPVDNKSFTLPLLNPEASLKFGIYF